MTPQATRRHRLRAALEQLWHQDAWPRELRVYVARLRRLRKRGGWLRPRPTQPPPPPRTTPRQTFLDGVAAPWPTAVWALWRERVAPLFAPGEACATANWSTQMPASGPVPGGRPCFIYAVERAGRAVDRADVAYAHVPQAVAREKGAL